MKKFLSKSSKRKSEIHYDITRINKITTILKQTFKFKYFRSDIQKDAIYTICGGELLFGN